MDPTMDPTTPAGVEHWREAFRKYQARGVRGGDLAPREPSQEQRQPWRSESGIRSSGWIETRVVGVGARERRSGHLGQGGGQRFCEARVYVCRSQRGRRGYRNSR
jgi:hypothetical protein